LIIFLKERVHDNLLMDEDQLIRQQRLNSYIRRIGGQALFIEKTGMNQGQVSSLQNGGRGMGGKLARKIEEQCGLPKWWLDGLGGDDPLDDVKQALDRLDGLTPQMRAAIIANINAMRGEGNEA
jgi:hypothetical protein